MTTRIQRGVDFLVMRATSQFALIQLRLEPIPSPGYRPSYRKSLLLRFSVVNLQILCCVTHHALATQIGYCKSSTLRAPNPAIFATLIWR